MNDRRPSKPPPPPGSRTPSVLGPGARFGKFEIVKRLALGAMTEVFAARVATLPRFQKTVVVKRLLPQLAVRPGYAEQFHEEACLAAVLHHPNLVEVYDVGVADGNHFISMELVDGETLETIAAMLEARQRSLPLEHALHVAIGLCAGLHYAHEKADFDGRALGLVHRDVTPQNVMVSWEGAVKLLDFGSAHCDEAVDTGVARTGSVNYMSPEQCVGAAVDRRADVYSLGVLLYELTVGGRLYGGRSDFDVMKQIVEEPVAAPRNVDAKYDVALERIVMRALEKDPERRFSSASSFGDALEVFVRERKMHVSTAATKQFLSRLFADDGDGWDFSAAPSPSPTEKAPPPDPSQARHDPWLPPPSTPAAKPKPPANATAPTNDPKADDHLAESWLALDAATETRPVKAAPARAGSQKPLLAPKLSPLARSGVASGPPSRKTDPAPAPAKDSPPLTDFLDAPKIIVAELEAPAPVAGMVTAATAARADAEVVKDLRATPAWAALPDLPAPAAALSDEAQPFPELPPIAVPSPSAVIAARPVPSRWPARLAIVTLASLPVLAAAAVVVAATRHPASEIADSPTAIAPIVPARAPDPPPQIAAPEPPPAAPRVILRQRSMELLPDNTAPHEAGDPPAHVAVDIPPPAVKPIAARVASDGNLPRKPIAARPPVDAAPKAIAPAGPPKISPPKKSIALLPAPAAVELPAPPVAADPPAQLDGEGTLSIVATPPCMVAVDGAWKGPTPVRTKVRAGKHVLFLSNPAIQLRKTIPVSVQPDQTLEKKFDFSQPQ